MNGEISRCWKTNFILWAAAVQLTVQLENIIYFFEYANYNIFVNIMSSVNINIKSVQSKAA